MENDGLKVSLPGSLHFGVPGENGATFVPFISNDGDLSWSNDKGLENPPTVNIRGPKGETGDKGEAGTAGKSAYEYARDGGYDGTEAQFSAKLAQEIPHKTSQLENDSHYMTEAPVTSVNGETGAVTINVPAKTSQLENDSGFVTAEDLPESSGGSGIHIGTEPPTDASVEVWIDPSEEAPEIGGSTQNAPLTFTGAVNATYDGSEAVTVEIPEGGGSGGESGVIGWETILDLTLTEAVMALANVDISAYTEIELYMCVPATPDGVVNIYVRNGVYKGVGSSATDYTTYIRAFWYRMHDNTWVGSSLASQWEDKLGVANLGQVYMIGLSMEIMSNNAYPIPAGTRIVIKGLK